MKSDYVIRKMVQARLEKSLQKKMKEENRIVRSQQKELKELERLSERWINNSGVYQIPYWPSNNFIDFKSPF